MTTAFLSSGGRMILKATANNAKPTPGYLLAEIEKRSFVNQEECEVFEKCLRWQLKQSSWKVKYKSLVIIRRLAQRGNSVFKRLMKTDTNEIKKCQSYVGKKDPVMGDEPNRRVREAAKQALAALHAEGQTRLKSGPKMEGFGTSVAPPPGKNLEAGDKALKFFKDIGRETVKGSIKFGKMIKEGSLNMAEDISGRDLGSERSKKKMGLGRPKSNTPGWSMASNRGNAQKQTDYGAPELDNATGSWGDSSENNAAPEEPTVNEQANRAASDGKYERTLVKELLSQGGMRPVPPAQSVQRFVMKCRSLDPTTMATILNEQLSKDSWQHRNKTLVTIEAILQDIGCRKIALVFKRSHISIEAQLRHPKPTIKKKAMRVMGLIERIKAPAPAPAPAPAADEGGFSFMGGDEGGDDDDMFGGMEMAGGEDGGGDGFDFIGEDNTGGNNDDMFGDMDMVAPDTSEPAPAAGGDGFDFLGGGGSEEVTPPVPQPAPASNDDLLNMYGGGSQAPVPAPSSGGGDLFDLGGMSSPAPAPAPSTGGGFDDLLGGMSAPAPAPTPSSGGDLFSGMSVPAPAPTPSSGGDLLGGMGDLMGAPSPAPAGGNDLLGGLDMTPTMANTTPRSNSIYSAFDSLNMGGAPAAQMPGTSSFSKYNATPAPAPTAPAPAPASSNSGGFGFMGGGGGGSSDAFNFVAAAMKDK